MSESSLAIGLYWVRESMTMCLTMEMKAADKVFVRLPNQQGQIIHLEVVNRLTMKYACNFDFFAIQDGRYTIEAANGAEVKRKQITLATPAVLETPTRTLVAHN